MRITVRNRELGTRREITVRKLDDYDIQRMTGIELAKVQAYTEKEFDYEFYFSDVLKTLYIKQSREVIAEYDTPEGFINLINESMEEK